MTGQGVIGRDCAWCGRPAVCEIEVQPAQYRSVARVDPITGERASHKRLVRSAVCVPACDDHKQINSGQPPRVAIPRERRASDVDQLGLFVDSDTARLRSAIRGEVGR
jgi:hypothetical protein